MLWVPPGFAHGFLALEDGTDFIYKCTEFYAPQDERTILWSDPSIGIEWPDLGMAPLVSAKDAAGVPLAEAEVYP
jgi:dTDP-4-dehydrorhamnose 3,5-epimerase